MTAISELAENLIIDGTKVMYYPERIAAWERGEKIAPITIDCAMTRACNAACIVPQTNVLMADGTCKQVIDIVAGDQVASVGDDGTKQISTVVKTWLAHESSEIISVEWAGGRLRCTFDHLVMTPSKWVRADELAEGVTIITADGERQVESISGGYRPSPVYDLECIPHHNFVASGVVVHNCHFCFAQMQSSESEGKITKKVFFDFLDDAAEIGVRGVSFISDGESTVVPWYADAVEHASALGLKVGAGSNGIRLTKPILERVLPHLSYLRFNFSAGERKRYAEIMGVPQSDYEVVVQNIKDGMEIIRRDNLPCSLNMQMVCDPVDGDQIVPFAKLSAELKPVYSTIKHCADDVLGQLGVDYSKYDALIPAFDEAEEIGRQAGVRIEVKRGRLDGKRKYTKCFGPPFIMQLSGNGTVAPCGFLFNERYRAFHLGSIITRRFKDIWASDRYDEVMRYLASDEFNPQERCGKNCLQHNTCDWMFRYENGQASLPILENAPPDLAFI